MSSEAAQPATAGSPLQIDLNSDLGEHFGVWRMGDDEAMLDIVTSANIACGFHAGDPRSIRETLRAAAKQGVAVGAHVSYPDLVGFGRRPLDIASEDLEADVLYQIGALQAMARAEGAAVSYVKPHGALYNTMAHDERQAAAVIRAVSALDADLSIVCLAGSPVAAQIEASGLQAIPEAFADRAYEPDGSLVSRRDQGAVLANVEEVADRMLRLVTDGLITARDGSTITLKAKSICVHGDSPGAVQMASEVRGRLIKHGVQLRPFAGRR